MERNYGGLSEQGLYEAAVKGDVTALLDLLQQNPILLDKVSYTCPSMTPLHIATMKNHTHFVEEVLNHSPQVVELSDSQGSSALHVASAKGYVEIAKKLLAIAPDLCYSRDCQGRNPLHLAAMKGHSEVLKELVEIAPLAARENLDQGHTMLHLCVKHGQFETLGILVPELDDLLNSKDDKGDTLLHLAIRAKRKQIIQYLVTITSIDVNAKNFQGQTAMALLKQTADPTISEIIEILRPRLCNSNDIHTRPVKWLTKKRDAIMVVAVLIATMAFQVAVSPPGGAWQDDSKDSNGILKHRAGEAVMAYHHPKAFKAFMRSNTIAFVASLSTILLLISGLPFRRKLFLWILMVIMWLTITSIAVTYAIAITVVTPKKDIKSLIHVIEIALVAWCSVMAILLVGNTARLIDRWLKNKGIVVWRPKRFRSLTGGTGDYTANQESV